MRYDDPNVSASAVIGIIGAILLFVVIVALQALFYSAEEAERARKVHGRAGEEAERLTAEQQEILNSYRWIDQQAGVVGIPIERAMELVAGEAATE